MPVDWENAFDEIEREKNPLPYVDIAAELKPRRWLIPDRIPGRNVTLLSGEGAIGKSTLLMQLLGATVLAGGQWLGTLPEHGPALYLTAEEEDNEARLRLEAVAESLGTSRYKLKAEGLKVLSLAGRDAVLAAPDKSGFIRPTELFRRIREDVLRLKPKLIGIDAAADVFAGNEINRAQTRQFITLLRSIAIDTDSAVILVAHPSLQGITSDTGLSGNTAWHNSVRARAYFKKAPSDDKSLRVLEVKKNNYGPEQESILLRWKDGVYVVVEGGESSIEKLADDARVDDLFLKLLRRFAEQGRNVSDKDSAANRAPKKFAGDPEAKATNTSARQFDEAMARLFAAGRIKVLTEGRPSHQTSRIVETATGQGAEIIPFGPRPTPQPTTGQPRPTPERGEGGGPPYISPPESAGGVRVAADSGGRAADDPAPADRSGPSVGSPSEDTVASVPFMITAAMKEELKRRGFTDDELFYMKPERARSILADPKRNTLTERYGKGSNAPPETVCRVCKKPGARYFGEPNTVGMKAEQASALYPLHLECCQRFFESGLPI